MKKLICIILTVLVITVLSSCRDNRKENPDSLGENLETDSSYSNGDSESMSYEESISESEDNTESTTEKIHWTENY